MSRSSTRKAVPANPAPDTPAAAPVAATPDPAKGTPQVAPETTGAAVAAAALVDPHMPTGPGASAEPAETPDGEDPSTATPVEKQPPFAKGFVLRVKGPAKGRWRAGRHFGPEEVKIAAADLTEDEIAQLNGDPLLTVLVEGEA